MANETEDTEFSEVLEHELWQRDVRVSGSIAYTLKYKRDLAEQFRRDAAELEKDARRIEQAVMAGKYWQLEGILESADIESLCNTEPMNRAELLTEQC